MIDFDLAKYSVRDIRDLCRVAGLKLQDLQPEEGKPATIEVTEDFAFGMYWIEKRRGNPDLTYDDVLDMPFAELIAALTTPNGNGNGSPGKAPPRKRRK